MDRYLPANPLVATALVVGSLPAIAFAIAKAYSLRSTSTRASTLFFGDHHLNVRESSRSLFASWMSVGTVIVGALIVAVTYRFLAAWAVLTWVAGFLILAKHAPAIISEASEYTTIHSFIRVRFGSPALGRFTSMLAIVTAAGVIALELIVGAALFRAAGLPGSPVLTVCVMVVVLALVAVVYTRLGGISAVIATDRAQTIGIALGLVSLLVIAFFAPSTQSAVSVGDVMLAATAQEPETHQLFALITFFVGFGAFQLFLLLGDMTTWQRIQLGQDAPTVRSAARAAALSNLLAWTLLLITGLLLLRWPIEVIHLPEVGGDLSSTIESQAEPLTSLLAAAGSAGTGLPQPIAFVLIGVTAFGLLSAVLSTCDSFLLIAVQAFLFEWTKEGRAVRDLVTLRGSRNDEELARRATRLIPLFMLAALFLFGLLLGAGVPLVSVIFFVFSFQCAISPLAVLALYAKGACKRARHVALWSLSLTALVIIFLFLLSATASSLSLAYAYSYLAPVAAIGIPSVAMLFLGLVRVSARPLVSVGRWLIQPPQPETSERVSHAT